MKEKLQKLGYKVMTKKVEWNGDILYILLNPKTDSYIGSFKMSDDGIIYSTEFKDLSVYELKDLVKVLVDEYEKL